MKILFLTNIDSPYRVWFFDALGRDAEVTALFSDSQESQTDRAKEWFVSAEGYYRSVYLERKVPFVKGPALCLDVIDWLKKPWDHIVLCGYSSPTVMLAMAYLRMRKIPFWLEVDGGLIRPDKGIRFLGKKALIGSADRWLSSGKATTDYLVHYGAKREAVREYPFSSVQQKDILEEPVSPEEKKRLRQELEIGDGKVILSIGQFIHRKGYDILLKAAKDLQPGADIYIIGGEPTQEYLQLCQDLELSNIHFLGFMKKERLLKYYRAADLFVLPTREDIWGLVINEAMAFALPVITTDRCVAGLELVEEGVSGYIVPVEDVSALAEKMNEALNRDLAAMGAAALETVRPYTVENMAAVHKEIFETGS